MTSKTAEIKRLYRYSSLTNREIANQVKVHPHNVSELSRRPSLDSVVKVSSKHLDKIVSLFKRNNIPFETADGGFELTEYYESKLNDQ